MSDAKKILFQVSGSIAAFKAVALASKLVQAGYDLEVVMSEGAEYFIGAASFEGLTRKKVHRGTFDEGTMMSHIDLERAADLILLYPATANTIASLAQGLGNSLISTLFLAHEFKKPYWIAPAMNTAMLHHPATTANLSKLESWGVRILAPSAGSLACGEIGDGRLMEPEDALKEIETYFTGKISAPTLTANPKKTILITAGGTREKIDEVRSIVNTSTGRTGQVLAETLMKEGHAVTLLQSKSAQAFMSASTNKNLNLITYDSTSEFKDKLKTLLSQNHYDTLIHAAAVADYQVKSVTTSDGRVLKTNKIQGNDDLVLILTPNEKIITNVRQWSKNPKLEVISFKLTADAANDLKLETYDSEWIIHNELKNVGPENHVGTIYQKISAQPLKHQAVAQFKTKFELSQNIRSMIEGNPL
jgi:phosphopantothenoylcysteine decarboxylase/phosphopantothenate--cysteine ligase